MGSRKRRSATDVAAMPLLVAGLTIAAAGIGRRIFRHTQIFCPSRDPVLSWNPADYGIPAGAVEEQWIETPSGEMLHGWYCRSERPLASALFCHGNKGNLTVSADVIPFLLNAGLNVLIFDYRGFGRSTGRASVAGVIADGVAAARFHDRIRPSGIPSVAFGFSLGGAIAAQVIRRHHFDGVILQSTFTSLPQIARILFPRAPLHVLAGKLFDTLSVIRALQAPLLILHGTADEVIPPFMARQLFEACPSPKEIHLVEGGLHKDLFVRSPDTVVPAISEFIGALQCEPQPEQPEEASAIEQWVDRMMRTARRIVRRRASQHT